MIASWAFGWQLLSKECWALLRLHTYNLSILNAVFQLPCLKFQLAPLFRNKPKHKENQKPLFIWTLSSNFSQWNEKKKGYFDRLTLFFSSSCVCNCLTSAPNKPFDALLDSVNWDVRSLEIKLKIKCVWVLKGKRHFSASNLLLWPHCQCAGLSFQISRFRTWLGQCVVFLGKTLFSLNASLYPQV